MLGALWPVALDAIGALGDVLVEVTVRDDDAIMIDAVITSGFSATGEAGVATWMPAAGRPPVSAIPAGFRLAARSDSAQGLHPLARRNGDQVAERLAECSLYRRDLDLAIYALDGQVAAGAVARSPHESPAGTAVPVPAG